LLVAVAVVLLAQVIGAGLVQAELVDLEQLQVFL